MLSTQLMNVGLTQTVYLQAVGTSTRIWLAGNGSSAYMVKSAVLTKGTASIVVKVNGHTSFQVPAMGRWSDYVSTAGFTLPGNATLSTVVLGEVPIIDMTPTGGTGWAPGIAVVPDVDSTLLFYVNFEDSFNDLVNGTEATEWFAGTGEENPSTGSYELNNTWSKWGSKSLYCVSQTENVNWYIDWGLIQVPENYTTQSWVYYEGVEMHIAMVFIGSTGYAYLDGIFMATMERPIPNPGGYYKATTGYAGIAGSYVDEVSIHSGALWTDNFTPPDRSVISILETTEVFSTVTITVSDNTQIVAGDTLTNNVGGIPIVYTFRNLPTGAANEILIGGTAAITAANIATALNATDGAIFTATSADNVVSVTAHTSEAVTTTTTSAGITIGDVIQTVICTTPDPVATLPAFTGNGFCSDGTGFLPVFIGAGTCTQDDFCIGRGVLPAMTCNAQSFITGILSSLTEQDKVSLLLYRNAYMQWFSPLVAIGSNDEIALMTTQFVANCISYATDTSLYGTSEYWADARETLYRAAGDCEDGAILIASILNNLGISYTRVRIYFGTFNGIGHAWIAYKRESDDKWVFIDWVKGSTYWNTISSIDELDTYEISLSSYTTAFAYMDCYKYVALTTAIYLDSFEDVISNVDWPEATIDATVGGNATGEITAPVATIYGLTGSNVEVEYPAVVLNGYILSGSAMAGHITNPSASITGQVEQDTLLTGTITAPTYIVRGSGFAIAVVTGAIEYPKSVIAGTMESPVDLLALRVNTTNMAVSQYSAFNFNSMCAFNGQILGANADGIFTHSGDKDVDENIEAYFDLPSFNYESARQKSFRRIYLDGLTEGNLIVTAIRDGVDGESFAIEALGRLAETQYVFPMSREDRGVNLALRIANKDGADFSINSISATLVFSNTLPQGYSAIGRVKITAPEYEVTANVC